MLHFFSSVVQLLNQFYKAFCKIGIVIAQSWTSLYLWLSSVTTEQIHPANKLTQLFNRYCITEFIFCVLFKNISFKNKRIWRLQQVLRQSGLTQRPLIDRGTWSLCHNKFKGNKWLHQTQYDTTTTSWQGSPPATVLLQHNYW